MLCVTPGLPFQSSIRNANCLGLNTCFAQGQHRDESTRAHTRTHTHTHARTHAHTHAHTHVGFYGLRGLSIGVMVLILYKLYVLLPYTYPTPKLSPHRRRCISIFPQKNSLCMIYKRFKLWGHWKCPHKSPSPCNTYVTTHTRTHTHMCLRKYSVHLLISGVAKASITIAIAHT